MNSRSSHERRTGEHVEQPAIPPSETKPRRRSWLLSALSRIATNGAGHDAATFFRIEYGGRNSDPHYRTARDEQLRLELLGPPPVGL